ncbi:helix-turn-helix transcriptional regulator [Fructilactobacillus myrtifloralis]|uniref:Helix-turn-helix transcriptional regulator n=1 Tax=Fructilactobacillus myrtifloralis TaxID=2940301 RepID=A0ABY5BPX9_9LACO|nr:helix-turn-helix transcriptional regulator [Fructilactobacillus myrtifloralis]USS85118.1 helix-turn-helix transcriptional regulator [Fructilactobacillus myrtifloralis]
MQNNLYEVMAKKMINIKQLSENTGVSRGTISRIKNKRARVFDFEVWKKLCDFLGVPLHDLIDYDPKNLNGSSKNED